MNFDKGLGVWGNNFLFNELTIHKKYSLKYARSWTFTEDYSTQNIEQLQGTAYLCFCLEFSLTALHGQNVFTVIG